MEDDDDHWATAQLRAIGELTADLEQAGIRCWMMGGWAMDFHLGRISRPHSDVDLAVHRTDRDALADVVARRGFTTTGGDDVAGVELFSGPGVRLEITYVAVGDDGRLFTPGFEHWPYPPGVLGDDRASFRGLEVPVMSVAGLLDTKQNWQREVGEVPRPHDLADVELLRGLLERIGRRPMSRRARRGLSTS